MNICLLSLKYTFYIFPCLCSLPVLLLRGRVEAFNRISDDIGDGAQSISTCLFYVCFVKNHFIPVHFICFLLVIHVYSQAVFET